MQFTTLDKKMRVYETAHDHCALPGMYLIARIDGRCFSTLTRMEHPFEVPYDKKFQELMLETTIHLMQCGFRVLLGYSQSDEINLLLHPDDTVFSRKLRKLNSVLASEAGARFSLSFGHIASFDCRISQIPSMEKVLDYFRWRQEDASRNALNGYCYWHYRKQGLNDAESHQKLMGVSNSEKHELLFQKANINFNDLPEWQKRGFAVYWNKVEKKGVHPKTGEEVISFKRKLYSDLKIPMGEAFENLVKQLLTSEASDKETSRKKQ